METTQGQDGALNNSDTARLRSSERRAVRFRARLQQQAASSRSVPPTRNQPALFNDETARDPSPPTGNRTTSSVKGASSKSDLTTSASFAVQATRNGILPPHNSKPPANIDALRQRYTASRALDSFTESDFNRHVKQIERAPNKATIVAHMLRRVLKDSKYQNYEQCFGQLFTGFPKDVGVNNGLPPARPDFVEGPVLDEYQPMPIDKIHGAVLYADNRGSITLPHIAGEWRESGGNLKTTRMQSGYTGAALVYARNQALGEIGAADPPGHASVTTFTTDGNTLDLYAHYAEDGKYHQRIVCSASLTGSYQGFRQGYRMLRNAQDHARETSYALRDELRAHYRVKQGTPGISGKVAHTALVILLWYCAFIAVCALPAVIWEGL